MPYILDIHLHTSVHIYVHTLYGIHFANEEKMSCFSKLIIIIMKLIFIIHELYIIMRCHF